MRVSIGQSQWLLSVATAMICIYFKQMQSIIKCIEQGSIKIF